MRSPDERKKMEFDSIWVDNKMIIIIYWEIESNFMLMCIRIPKIRIFICCMRHINKTLSHMTIIRHVRVSVLLATVKCECCLKFGCQKIIFELMTDLMRKMKATACGPRMRRDRRRRRLWLLRAKTRCSTCVPAYSVWSRTRIFFSAQTE